MNMTNVNGTSRRMTRRARRGRQAFSLIELLLVLVILAILAAVVVPKITGRSDDARKAAAQTDISALDGALDQFYLHAGRYPTNDEGLGALIAAPGDVREWKGPYIKRGLPKDPWGNPYVYRYPGQMNGTSPDLLSMGADGREGADDIGNWATETQ